VWLYGFGLLAGLCAAPLGCAADDKFAAETDDEYTERLTDAVIGTPDGVLTIGADGVATPSTGTGGSGAGIAGSSSIGGSPSIAGGPGIGGAAGSIGIAGSFATGGSGTAGGVSSGGVGNFGGVGNTGGIGEAGSGGSGTGGGFGQWHFDDCSPNSHFLLDSSGLGANAQQALNAKCVPGISGQGVQFTSAKDIVQVPDEPQFTIDQHVGVAAWVNPTTVSGDQPIVIKRLNNKTAFSLGIHNGNIEMSVVLSTGKTVISRAPIAAGKWTHVAGLYDGTFVFLFINGQQFGQVFAAGNVRDVFAPIRIGATTSTQHFNGIIDEVFLSTQPISASTLTALSCISRPSTLSVNPLASGPVPPDTNFHFDVNVTDNDVGACSAKTYEAFVNSFEPGISTIFDSPKGQFQSALPGQTINFGVSVSASDLVDPGAHPVSVIVDSFGNQFEQLLAQLNFEVAAPTGCFVSPRKELMITNTSVVDDPIRTAGSFDPLFGGGGGSGGSGAGGEAGAFDAGGSGPSGGTFGVGGSGVGGKAGFATTAAVDPGNPSSGVWSFGHLMREMAPTPAQAPAFTLALFQHWLSDQVVNGFTVAARPRMQQQLLDIWPKTADGGLDLDQSPLTLQAIVNRIDTRNLAEGSAGEGRFVFGVNGNINFQQFTLIVEYNLPAQTDQDVLAWANRWHALATHPFPSEEYNTALEALTRLFTDRNALPSGVNGSALVELRTNEIALEGRWQLRSFALSPTTGFLDEVTVKETPDLGFNNTATFANFVNQNAAGIIAEVPGANAHTVPLQFGGSPFMGGSVFNDLIQWNGPGITNPDARFHASMNTCNGCHGPETNTGFLMITPRFPGSEAQLSPFITGTQAFDPFSGQVRNLNDLARRKADLTALVCSSTALKTAASKSTASPVLSTTAPTTKSTKK
jgi:hypothetical protein